MSKLQVFDPAMCCSTGVCGPSVDPALAHFASDLEALKSAGVVVERFNLASFGSGSPQAAHALIEAIKVSNDSPVLLDRFLNDAIEVDVDAVSVGHDLALGTACSRDRHRPRRRPLVGRSTLQPA